MEDELLIALDLQLTMEDEGAVVVLADGVEAGLDLVRQHEMAGALPDIAVLDVRLGDGEVFPVADKLAEAGVPIVFHSGHAQGVDLARGYPDAAVLSKPAPAERLMEAITDRLR